MTVPRPSQRELRHAEGIPSRHTSRSVIVMGNGDAANILRASAREVWDALGDDWTSVADLAEVIAERHRVSTVDVAGDLELFLDELLDAGLLEARAVGGCGESHATDH